MSLHDAIPKEGYCSLSQIIGDKNARPKPSPAVVPSLAMSKTTWYKRIQTGLYPRPIRAGRCATWRWADIRRLVERMEGGG